MGLDDAQIADWRLPSKGSAARKKGGKSEPVQTSWWLSALTAVGGAFTEGLGAPNLLEVASEDKERAEAMKGDLEDKGLLLEDRSELFSDAGGSNEVAEAFAFVTDWRDAILLASAEAAFDFQTGTGRRSPTRVRNQARAAASERARLALFDDPAGGGGGGSGAARPVYVAPDRRVVEEFVGDKQIVLTGRRRPELNSIVDAYMADHRRQWEGKSVDPKQTVMERIRGTAEYKRIHTLRGEAADENSWVNARQDRLMQLGVGAKAAEARGIELAATGASLANIDVGKFQAGRGRKDITMMRRLEKVAEQIGGQI